MSTLFWDFDGTLVYSHHLWSGSMYRALLAVSPSCGVTFSQIRECNTRGFTWQTPHRNYTAYKGEAWWLHFEAHAYTAYISCGVSPADAATAASLVKYFIKQAENYHLFPDTLSTLKTLRERGHRHVLLSNNFPDLTDILAQIGLLSYFDGVILSAIEGYDKPRKELFQIATDRFPDSSYYMIGDNINADIRGGNQAGIPTILVHSGHSELANLSAESLSEICSFIR